MPVKIATIRHRKPSLIAWQITRGSGYPTDIFCRRQNHMAGHLASFQFNGGGWTVKYTVGSWLILQRKGGQLVGVENIPEDTFAELFEVVEINDGPSAGDPGNPTGSRSARDGSSDPDGET